MYGSALLDHGVPSSNARRVVPISLQNFLTSCGIYSLAMSAIMAVGAPISFENCLMACRTSNFHRISTTYTNPLSVMKSWQHMCRLDDHPPFFVAKNVSMKK